MIPIDFKGTWSKVKVKPVFLARCVVHSISFDPFTWSIPNLVQGLRPCLVRINSNFVFCTKGGIYVSKTFLVFRSVGGARQTNYNIITRKWNFLERRRGDLPLFLRPWEGFECLVCYQSVGMISQAEQKHPCIWYYGVVVLNLTM